MAEMSDGGASLIDELVGATASGAADYEEVLALLVGETGEASDEMQASLADLYASLTQDLAEALATGSDPSVIEDNLDIVRDLLADLGLDVADFLDEVEEAQSKSNNLVSRGSGRGGSSSSRTFAGDADAFLSGGGSGAVISDVPIQINSNLNLDGEVVATNQERITYNRIPVGV